MVLISAASAESAGETIPVALSCLSVVFAPMAHKATTTRSMSAKDWPVLCKYSEAENDLGVIIKRCYDCGVPLCSFCGFTHTLKNPAGKEFEYVFCNECFRDEANWQHKHGVATR